MQLRQNLRKDITGLRAIAVLAVTLYHIAHVLAPENLYFQGGFLGVDIFFVISGFLMTKIIMTGLERNNFSLYTFYKRRAKRICPALLVVVVTFICVSLLIMDTASLMKSLRDGLRALGFISNMWLAKQTGYFDGAATERIFLHTWSLSVEWQFYLLYPLILMLLNKLISPRNIGLIILGLTIASLIFGCVFTVYQPTLSYFYLPSRAYELLIGALAYFYPLSYFLKNKVDNEAQANKIATYVESIGLLSIVVSLIVVDSSEGWPNVWSILPLFGTYLCIAANNQRTLLSNIVFQKLGLWSYAIYLVHWPIVVLFGKFGNQSLIWGLLPVILLLGVALHYGVERRRNFGWIFLIIYFACAGSIQWLIKTDASTVRNVAEVSMPSGSVGEQGNKGNIFHIGDTNKPVDFILTGDSFSRHFVSTLDKYALHVVTVIKDDCFSTGEFVNIHANLKSTSIEQCRLRYDNLLKVAAEYPDTPIVWAQNWSGYGSSDYIDRNGNVLIKKDFIQAFTKGIPQVVSLISNEKRKIYIVNVASLANTKAAKQGVTCFAWRQLDNVLTQILYKMNDCAEFKSNVEQPANLALQRVIAALPENQSKTPENWSVSLINLDQALCEGPDCRVMLDDSNEPVFFDGSHFSEFGSDIVVPYVLKQMHINADLIH